MDLIVSAILTILPPALRVLTFLFLFGSARECLPFSVTVTLSLALGAYSSFHNRSSPFILAFPESGLVVAVEAGGAVLSGLLFGLPLVLGFETAVQSFRIWDIGRGTQFAEQVEPMTGRRNSALEGVAPILCLSLILLSGWHLPLFKALCGFPLPQLAPNLDLSLAGYLERLLLLSAAALTTGVAAALPIFALGMTLDLTAGFLCRFAPRFNVTQDTLALRSFGGLVLLALGFGPFAETLQGCFTELIEFTFATFSQGNTS